MTFYLRAVLASHVAAGAVAFICASVALLTAKGGHTHRRWGRICFRATAVVAATALFLSIVLPIVFLALVAVFRFYAALSGYRILSLRRLGKSDKPHFVDWCAALLTLGSSAALPFSEPFIRALSTARGWLPWSSASSGCCLPPAPSAPSCVRRRTSSTGGTSTCVA